MYPVSQAFQAHMKADLRRIDAKVVIDYTDHKIDQSLAVVASEQANVSYPAQTADGVVQATHKWASLDGSWILDGTWHLAPGPGDLTRYQMGWWGSQLSGPYGAFATPYPTLTVTHIPRPVHTLRVVGDSARGEYPVDFRIDLYAQDGTLLRSEVVTGNAAVEWSKVLPAPVLDVAKQVLTITRWSHPGRQAKVLEFFTSIQETYYSGDVVEIKLLEEREASQGSLPVGNISANEISIKLANVGGKFDVTNRQSPLAGLLKPNRRIRAWLGVRDDATGQEEWVPLGVFWSLDWDSPDDSLEASVVARDRLELLRKSTYQPGSVQQNVSLYTLAEQVLQDAGLQPGEYWIDPALQSTIIPWAWLSPTSHREALRIIAEAALAVVYADRDGVVRIESMTGGLGAQPVLEITANDYFPPLQAPSRQDQVANEIVVTTQPLRPADEPQEIYRSATPIRLDYPGEVANLRIRFSQVPVIDVQVTLENAPPDVIIAACVPYAWGAEVSIWNFTSGPVEVTLVATGRPLSVQGGEQVVARDEQSIVENGTLRYEFPDNPLVQTLQQAQAIATALLASAKDPRRDLELEWRGNPALELGDRVTVVGQDVYVIRQELTWAGSLSARLTGRKVT